MGLINDIKQPMLVSTDTAPVYAPVVQGQCAWFNYSKAIKSPGPNNSVVSFPLDVLDNDRLLLRRYEAALVSSYIRNYIAQGVEMLKLSA